MNPSHMTRMLNELADEAVPNSLDLWPAIQSQVSSRVKSHSQRASIRTIGSGWRRRAVLGLAAAAALSVAAVVASLVWGHPQPVDAQVILDRAEATAQTGPLAVTSYHLQMVRQSPAKGNATITTDVWYSGSDHRRSDEQIKSPSAATLSSSGVIFNGSQTWIYNTADGQTRVIHTTGTTWNDPIADPSQQTSLADLISQYGSKSCMSASQHGDATVAGRPTYVIVLTPRQGGCVSDGGGAKIVRGGASGSQAKVADRATTDTSVGQMTVWVDEQTFLPLKTEVRNSAGVVLDSSKATSVQYNVAIPPGTFIYTPPLGAMVQNFTGGTGAQVKEAMSGNSSTEMKVGTKPSAASGK